MPPDPESTEGSWGFRSLLLFVAALIGWLVWAMIEFTPTAERDIAKSLLASPLFQRGDFAITNQPSKCRVVGEVKGSISASLYQSFQAANDTNNGTLQLHRFQKERQVLDETRTPFQWFREIKRPVMAISNVGVHETHALVCLELHASSSRGMLVTLEHVGADYWRMVANEQAWEDIVEKPEEIPELTTPIVD